MKHRFLILLTLGLCACGIKPGQVAPPDSKEDHFPRTYPDIRTDPQTHAMKTIQQN